MHIRSDWFDLNRLSKIDQNPWACAGIPAELALSSAPQICFVLRSPGRRRPRHLTGGPTPSGRIEYPTMRNPELSRKICDYMADRLLSPSCFLFVYLLAVIAEVIGSPP